MLLFTDAWMPAFAGMTNYDPVSIEGREEGFTDPKQDKFYYLSKGKTSKPEIPQSAQRLGHSITIFLWVSKGISCKAETTSRLGFALTSSIKASEAQRYSSYRVFLIHTRRRSRGLMTPDVSYAACRASRS